MDASKAQAVGIIALDQLYLATICESVKNECGLDAVLQDLGGDNGRLYLTPRGTTAPAAILTFSFGDDAANFAVLTRNQQSLARVVKYAEGVDGFVKEFVALLNQNLLGRTKRAA